MSVTREVTQRPGRPGDMQLAAVEPLVLNEAAWFKKLLPDQAAGGLSAEMFAARLVWMLRKSAQGDGKLLAAAHNDPDSFLFAATECASWNLVPGEEYWFVPFEDRSKGTGAHVTGIPGWKGEIQQILRSGAASGVVLELVWRDAGNPALRDGWTPWKPAEMDVPDHTVNPDVPHTPANVWQGYGFARLITGGHTQPLVLGQWEFDRARSHSRGGGAQFWGTEDHDGTFRRGKFYPEMCRKTIVHRLYDQVPHSAGYVTQLLTAFQKAADRFPAVQMPGLHEGEAGDARLSLPPAVPGSVIGPPVPPNLPGVQQTAHVTRPGPPADDTPADELRGILGRIGRQFTSCGPDWAPGESTGQRLLVVTGALAVPQGTPPLQLTASTDLTLEQARLATDALGALITTARKENRNPAEDLQKVHDTATAPPAAEDAEDSGPGEPDGMSPAAAELLTTALAGIGVTDPIRVAESCSAFAHRALTGPGDLTGPQGTEMLAVTQRCADSEEPLVMFVEAVEGWLNEWAMEDEESFTAFDSARRAA